MSLRQRLCIPLIIVLLAGFALFISYPADFLNFLIWWLCFAAMGVIFLPITDLVFGKFSNGGYVFSKVFCLAAAGYLQWLLSSLRLLPFRVWSCFLVIVIFAFVNALINRKTGTWRRYIRDGALYKAAGRQEALFTALLLFWAFLRALKPDILGLEKLMDFGFLNSILRSDWLPAPDMWLAGMDVNYYYLGHFFTAFITRLTFIDPVVTYNLMMATLFALSFMLVYSVAEFLIEIYQKHMVHSGPSPKSKYAGAIAGIMAGLAVCVAGNLHSAIFGVLFPQWNIHNSYWFPSATRYIGYHPEMPHDMTIHEFPLYSFVVSDLHAHVINIIFVLAVIALSVSLAMNLLSRTKETIPEGDADGFTSRPGSRRRGIISCLALVIFLIGLFPAINFWDYPIYIVFTGAMLLYANLRKYKYSLKSVYVTLGQIVAIGAVAYIVLLPFHLSFDSMGVEIKLVKARSMLYQLGILWGWQLFFAAVLTHMMVQLSAKQRDSSPDACEAAEEPPPFRLFRFMEEVNPADALVFIIFICATGLFIIPEIIYVADIYPSHPRANTMFKLGYQAFIMFGLGAGYTFSRLLFEAEDLIKRKRPLLVIGSILLVCALTYPFFAIPQWYGNILTGSVKGLDGTKYMLTEEIGYEVTDDESIRLLLKDDYTLIKFINENIDGSPVIAEALGSSYTLHGRISAYTGLPNILNWYNHELLWRNSDYDLLDERRDDINALYESGDAARVREVIDKYNVQYIVIGEIERLRYPGLDEQLLMSMGYAVSQSNYIYDTYLIRVRPPN